MIKIGSLEIVNLPSADKVFVGGRLVWLSPDKYKKLTGNMYGDVVIAGRARFTPYERVSDGAIIYIDMYTGKEFENVGTGTPVSLGYA